MDEILNDKASDEIVERLMDIITFAHLFTQQVNVVAMLYTLGVLNADGDKLQGLIDNMQAVLDTLTRTVGESKPDDISTERAYDVLFTMQDAIPYVVELDNYLNEIGAPIRDNKSGETFSEYLSEAVKV